MQLVIQLTVVRQKWNAKPLNASLHLLSKHILVTMVHWDVVLTKCNHRH